MQKTLLLALVVLLATGGAESRAVSFLVNGDFEEGDGADVPGWSRGFYPQEAGDIAVALSRSQARAKSGRWSFRIDTGPVLGKETTLVFNGGVSIDAAGQRGKALRLSGWVYVEPGTAVRPIQMRLRTFGRDREGRNAFLGDVLQVTVLGKPGRWIQFQAAGVVPSGEVTSMDLHCSISPDMVRTVQFLDALRLELVVPPPLQMRPLSSAVWRDQEALPVEVYVNQPAKAPASLTFSLLAPSGKAVARCRRSPRTDLVGIPLPKTKLPEGRYLLRGELRGGTGAVICSAEAPVQLAASPWEGAPERPRSRAKRVLVGAPPGFRVMGSTAPTDLPDSVPPQPEMTGSDVDLSLWRNRGYVVFSRHYLDEISSLGRPRPGELGIVRLFASRGEYEPTTVSVWALRPQKNVRVAVSDLLGKGAVIAATNADVRIVRRVRDLPPFLEKRQAVDIPEGKTQTFWLTLYVPQEAPAGFYYGDITITPEGGQPTRLPLLLRVLPLRTPPPPKGYGFWWKMDGRWNGYYSKDHATALEHIRRQFILLREHGCNMVSCYGMPRMARAEDAAFTFDFGQDHWAHDQFSLADFFRLGRETGFLSGRVPIQYAGAESLHSDWIARLVGADRFSAAFAEFYRDACRRIDRWAKEQGFVLAFACVDEIGNAPERRQEALRFYRLAKEAGVLTSVTDNSMHGGVHLMGQRRFDDIIDMRLYNFVVPEMIDHAKRSGDRLWLYNLGSTGWDAKCDRFVFGFFTERCGAEGYSQWAFQWPSGDTSPYEAAAAGQRTGYHYALPAPDGPLPALALEGVREGIDDARYLHLLPPSERPAFLADIEPSSTAIPGYLGGWSGQGFDVRRWRIARRAMAGGHGTKLTHADRTTAPPQTVRRPAGVPS